MTGKRDPYLEAGRIAREIAGDFAGIVEVGDIFDLEVNQGIREAEVLAVIGDEALIEYQMPNGSTSLRIVNRLAPDERVYKNASYKSLPKKWRRAMDQAGSSWIGQPQGNWRTA